MSIIALLIVFFGVVNLIRLTLFLVGSDLYAYKAKIKAKNSKRPIFLPTFSIVIPAHNEEKTVLRAVRSIVRNKYPLSKRQIIVVDDGSTDESSKVIETYQKKYQPTNLLLIKQKASGKALALNNAIKNYATGELVMCLDSDSYLAQNGLRKVADYFSDPRVVAVSTNVKIIPTHSFLNLVQQFEYLVCYQMKRAQTVFNIEYIIGGIGSTFRKSVLEKVGYYDGNTVTEDIDLTMKFLQLGNKENRVIYAADVVTYTESVLDIVGLIRQRVRWKWGRSQTFLKNSNLFFNKSKAFNRWLTFVYLPFAIFSDVAFLLEPLFIGYILYLIIRFGDLYTLLSIFVIMGSYLVLNVALETTLQGKQKLFYLIASPFMYVFFYILSLVEYIALLVMIVKLPFLKKSISNSSYSWSHVERRAL